MGRCLSCKARQLADLRKLVVDYEVSFSPGNLTLKSQRATRQFRGAERWMRSFKLPSGIYSLSLVSLGKGGHGVIPLLGLKANRPIRESR